MRRTGADEYDRAGSPGQHFVAHRADQETLEGAEPPGAQDEHRGSLAGCREDCRGVVRDLAGGGGQTLVPGPYGSLLLRQFGAAPTQCVLPAEHVRLRPGPCPYQLQSAAGAQRFTGGPAHGGVALG
ncbi:hypothetical protein GCM10025734_17600 [Kitasatospora paranensis]